MNLINKRILFLFIGFLASNNYVTAQEGFIGEIRMFAGNYAPRNWAFCDGQLLSISSSEYLFAVIGCKYGGDCRRSFALPDLRGRVAMGAGVGPGLQLRQIAERPGNETIQLNISNLPAHSHNASVTSNSDSLDNNIQFSTNNAVNETPDVGDVQAVSNYLADTTTQQIKSFGPPTNTVSGQSITNPLPSVKIGLTGQNVDINIIQPSLVLRYIICTQGTFPSR